MNSGTSPFPFHNRYSRSFLIINLSRVTRMFASGLRVWMESFRLVVLINNYVAGIFLRPHGSNLFGRNFYLLRGRSLVGRAALGYIPTEDTLKKKGFNFASMCRLCKSNEETVQHVFVSCPFANAAWTAMTEIFQHRIDRYGSLATLLSEATKAQFSTQVQALWITTIASCIWLLWRTRNKCIFEDLTLNIGLFLRHIWRCIKELDFFGYGSATSVEDLQILKIFGMAIRPRKAPRIVSVIWHPPLATWIKCNTDGCALGNPRLGGAGGIFRNARSFPHGAFAVHLGSVFAFEAEIWAVIFAITKAMELNWRYLWLESDSTYVVDLLNKKSIKVPWKLRARWLQCLNFINTINFHAPHKFREGNKVAYALANYGARNTRDYWWHSCPTFVLDLVNDDLCNRENFRFC